MELLHKHGYDIPIFYEDNHLLVVEKPANIPVQADSSGDIDLLTLLKQYIGEKYNKPGAVYLGLVHRLDRPVGGVMVFARTSKAAARLSETFRTHEQDRRYLAVVEGTIAKETEMNDHLLKDPRTGMVRVVAPDASGAKKARLISRPISVKQDLTLTEVRLFTGRSHQIRVQHAHSGHPLWGDIRYGHGKPGRQIALWAYSITIDHPTKKTEMHFTSTPKTSDIWKLFESEIRQLCQNEQNPGGTD